MAPRDMKDVKDFLDTYVKGYLLHDVQEMDSIPVSADADGRCGYPMVISCVAGMELLGGLRSGPFTWSKDREHVVDYWQEYLTLDGEFSGG